MSYTEQHLYREELEARIAVLDSTQELGTEALERLDAAVAAREAAGLQPAPEASWDEAERVLDQRGRELQR